jgi:hypothetical protein
MKRNRAYLGLMFLQIGVLIGCYKPDEITTVKFPDEEIFFTIETSIGHGAISSDYTYVYAHVARNGKTDKKEILSGENLEIAKIIWTEPDEATVCLVDGITVTFRNYVTLSVNDGWFKTIRTHLQESSGGICPPQPVDGTGEKSH